MKLRKSVAENAEKSASKEEEVSVVDYAACTLEELVSTLEKTLSDNPVQKIKSQVDGIKNAFNLKFGALLAEKKAAFLEEGIKFALLIFFCVRLSDLNEPMDAIVYGAAIGLGYAAIENVGYLNYGNLETAWTLKIVKVRYIPLIMHLGFVLKLF